MATIKDVAALAGVSTGTVSNYLNQTKPVKKETAARIKEAVSVLGFVPNLSAKSLKSNLYTEIALVLPSRTDSFCAQICQGVEAALKGSGYLLHQAYTYDIPELERTILQDVQKKRTCGLILMSCQPQQAQYFRRQFADIPVVMVDRAIEQLEADFIAYDNESAMARLARMASSAGYHSPCLFCGPSEFSSEAACIRGFLKEFPLCGPFVIPTELSREDGFRKVTHILKTRDPDVIMTTSEATATGVMEGLNLLQKQIPVLTLGEEHWNRGTHSFSSCSLARSAMQLGRTAGQKLLHRLQQADAPAEHTLLPDQGHITGHLPQKASQSAKAGHKEPLRLLMLDTASVHAFSGLIPSFEALTGVPVTIRTQPHHQLLQEIQDRPDSYDIVLFDIPWLPKLAAGGILKDLSHLLSAMGSERFFPGCLQHYSSFRNAYYGIPFLYAPQILYYRRELFENQTLRTLYERQTGMSLRPPITLEEFNTVCDFFTNRSDAIPYGAGIAAAYDECFAPEIYLRLHAYGGRLMDNQGRVRLDSAAGKKAYQNLLQALPAVKPDYRQATDTTIVSDFLRGETAMLISYPAFLAEVTDLRKASMIGEIGCALCPGQTPLLGGWSLGISSRTNRYEESCQFLRWSCEESTAIYFSLLGGQPAITAPYTNDELVSLNPWLPLYHSAYFSARSTVLPPMPNGRIISADQADAIVCRWAGAMLDGTITAEEALSRTRQELETLLARYRTYGLSTE